MRNRSIVSPRKDLLNSIYMLIVVFSKHKEMVSHNEGDFFRCGNDAQLVGGSKISQTDRGGDHQRTKYRYRVQFLDFPDRKPRKFSIQISI